MSHNDQPIREVSVALRQLVLGWDRYRESIADELEVGTTEVVALGYLYHEGPLTPRDIGQRLGLTSGSVTALLDRLESSGFVSRSQNPEDRRSLLAAVTPAGRHAMQWFYEQVDAIVGEALESTPEVARETVIALAHNIGDLLTQRAAEPPEQRRR